MEKILFAHSLPKYKYAICKVEPVNDDYDGTGAADYYKIIITQPSILLSIYTFLGIYETETGSSNNLQEIAIPQGSASIYKWNGQLPGKLSYVGGYFPQMDVTSQSLSMLLGHIDMTQILLEPGEYYMINTPGYSLGNKLVGNVLEKLY